MQAPVTLANVGECIQQHVDAFLLDQAADDADHRWAANAHLSRCEQLGIDAELRRDTGWSLVALDPQHLERFGTAGDGEAAAFVDSPFEPAERRRVASKQVLPGEKQRSGAHSLCQQAAVGGGEVVRLFVEVYDVWLDLTQHPSEARPIEEMETTVETDGLDAQVVRPRVARRLELEGASAQFAPGRWRDHHQAGHTWLGNDLVELAAVRGNNQDLRDDQNAH